MPACCKMKGLLTFLVLWIIHKQPGSGQDVAREIAKRKGEKPSPGTLYPVLKQLNAQGMIESREGLYYTTLAGEEEVRAACKEFETIFYDMDAMCTC